MKRFARVGCLGALVVLVLAGCVGRRALEVRDLEIEDLRFQNQRRRESLAEALEEARTAGERLASAEAEKEGALSRLGALETHLRAQKARRETLERSQKELEERAARAERAQEKLKKTLEQVQADASVTVEELAELRLRREELEKTARDLNQRNAALHDDNTKLARELEDVRSQLLKEQAVVRSLSRSPQSGPNANLQVFQEQIRDLEKALARAEEEKRELVAKLERLESRAAGSPREAGAGTAARDPADLCRGLVTLVQARSRQALQGRFAGDAFDVALLGGLGLCLVVLLWGPMRFRKRRRERLALAALKRRVEELEAREGSDSETAGRPRRRARAGSYVRRKGRFSPIISSETQGVAAQETRSDVAARPGRAGRFRPAAAPEEAPSRDPAAVPAYDDGAGGEGEEVEVTVLLGRRTGEDLQEVSSPGARAAPEPALPWAEEEVSDADDEFANTQIISGLEPLGNLDGATEGAGTRTSPAGERPGRRRKDEESELLAELKEIIGQKFDELRS